MWVDRRTTRSPAVERAPNADAFLGIEADSRLVDDQQVRVVQQCLCDPSALVHPAGERVEPAVADVLEVDQFQQFVRACAGSLPVQPPERGDVLQKLLQAQAGVGVEVLWEVAEPTPDRPRIAGHARPVPRDLPLRGFGDGRQQSHQRRLPGAVRPHQPVNPRLEGRRHVSDSPGVRGVLSAERRNF